MKKAAYYANRIKQLYTALKKQRAKVPLAESDGPMETLLLALLSNYAAESRAAAALAKLRAAAVDYNELRVTPAAEIIEVIGADYPSCRPAAQDVVGTLQALFNKLHHLDLAFLASGSRRAGETFLGSLDGLQPHAHAMMIQRCLKGHAVPLDVNMYATLRKLDCIPEDLSVADAQRLLAANLKDKDALNFYAMFKRFASTHAPRKAAVAAAAPPTRHKAAPHAEAMAGTSADSAPATVSRRTAPQVVGPRSRKPVCSAKSGGGKPGVTVRRRGGQTERAGAAGTAASSPARSSRVRRTPAKPKKTRSRK